MSYKIFKKVYIINNTYKMKKSILLISLLLLGSFAFAANEFPKFPMTIYGNIKIWSTNLAWWTLKVTNSSNQELASYNINQIWKYWSDNVGVLPLLLNEFSWKLNFTVSYNWKTYVVDSIDDSNRWNWCPSKSSITFVSENCRYDITLKEKNTNTWWSSSGWSSGWSSGKTSWWSSWGGSSASSNKSTQTNNKETWVVDWSNKVWSKTENKTDNKQQLNTNKNAWAKVPALVFTFKTPEYSKWNPSDVLPNWLTREMDDAYKFAYENWITTVNNIKDAKMNTPLTRIAMAKMLSNYAMNILWKEPDFSKWTVKFNDVTNKLNLEYDNAPTLAYQLGIMWQNMKDNNFRPNDIVTRAEFATALSRLLYSTPDWNPYYSNHLSKLKQKWIITDDDPKIKEKRWYVMIMLMRTVR